MTDAGARRLAEALHRRGLAVPVRLLADAHRPLAPLLSDFGAAVGPLIGVAIGRRGDDARALLAADDGLERLIGEIDDRVSGETRAEPG